MTLTAATQPAVTLPAVTSPAAALAAFDLARLRAALVGTRFSGSLHHFPVIESTNTALLTAAAAGAPEGTVYFADEQTAGRGRSNHTWHSAPGDGLYLSALVAPSLHLRDALHLSLATGLAAAQAIQDVAGVRIDIRWPNDLMAGTTPGNEKKLGGILVETAVEPGSDPWLRYAVIGVGINVCHQAFPPELAPLATSLTLVAGASVSRHALLIALLREIDIELTRLETTPRPGGNDLLERFSRCSTWVHGRRVQVPEQGGYTGSTAGLDEQGFLLVDADDGTRRTVLSGGVRSLSA